jgi:glycosyltransferase involved in cell wall biosynthesis
MCGMSISPIRRLLFSRYVKRGGKLLHHAFRLFYEKSKQSAFSRWRLMRMPDFDRLLKAISVGSSINPDDLLPYLCLDSKQDRIWVNYSLADAFHQTGNNEQASVFIQRVWNLSVQDVTYLPLYVAIHKALGDMAPIRGAYKSLGMKKASAAKVSEALDHFHSWQYTDAIHRKADEYYYDFEVLDCISRLAEPQAFPAREPESFVHRKVRLAYLVFGMTHLNSVIVKNSLTLASFHDASQFDVTFYIPDQATTVLERKEAVENIKQIEKAGCKVVIAPDSLSEIRSLHEIAKSIYESRPDILVTTAALADFKHFYITMLRPAPLVVGLCQGPPPQYIAPSFDWSISWTKHPMMDCPTHCTLVDGAAALPERTMSTQAAKSKFGIPENDLVVMSCGRPFKFQDQGFWISILDVLRVHPNTRFVVVGIDTSPSFLDRRLTPDIAGRVRMIGRVKDFHSLLSMADVVVDTYPSGGGMTVVDAMAMGIPVVSFRHNYMRMFSQTDWSPAAEFMGMPELLVDRGDFTQLGNLLSRLLTDREYRSEMSRICKVRIQETSGNQAQMVRDCEKVYLNVMRLRASSQGST